MAKSRRRNKEIAHEKEHLVHCSGPDWEGDGSKATSGCPFKQSLVLTAIRYKCHYCVVKLARDSIFANHDGPTRAGLDTPFPSLSSPK